MHPRVRPERFFSDMQFMEPHGNRLPATKAFDLTPVFAAIMMVFVIVSALQFSRAWPDAQRGLLLFEKACPLSHSAGKS